MPFLSFPQSIDLFRLRAAQPQRYPFLLQTLGGAPGWDVLLAYPQQTISQSLGDHTPFLPRLDSAWAQARASISPEPKLEWLPFHGGWFVYLGYELLQELEPTVAVRDAGPAFPTAYAARVPAAIMVDQVHGTTYFYAEPEYAHLLDAMRADLAQAPVLELPPVRCANLQESPAVDYLDGVARIKRYILEGDVFQVNLARRWQAELVGGADALYGALRQSNAAPFGGMATLGEHHIISSSPERLARAMHGAIETRPIAGTRARASDPDQDLMLKAELLATAKERAEHIMLVDLERNDLGRICRAGSVSVPALLEVATYAHVHHLESTVRGELQAGLLPSQLIRALFPGGTITGCPKVRCMQIIRELETAPRLAYTGSMGYLNHDGSLDFNILIRSFMLHQNQLSFWAGAGIVADSIPERELDETRAKAKGLLRALAH